MNSWNGSGGRLLRTLLAGLVLLAVIWAGFQGYGVFAQRTQIKQKREQVAQAAFAASLEDTLEGSVRLMQSEAGLDGTPIPQPVLDKLKENYTLPAMQSKEKEKKVLARAAISQLRTDLGVDEGTAAFLKANADAGSWEEFAQRKRQIFEENEEAIEPLIVARIARIAAECGIEKLDQLKVDPPKTAKRTKASAKTNGTTAQAKTQTTADSVIALRDREKELLEALKKKDDTAIQKALVAIVDIAASDPSVQRDAIGRLDKMLKEKNLSKNAEVQLRLAALQCQPTTALIASKVLLAHFEAEKLALPKNEDEEKKDAKKADDKQSADAKKSDESAKTADKTKTVAERSDEPTLKKPEEKKSEETAKAPEETANNDAEKTVDADEAKPAAARKTVAAAGADKPFPQMPDLKLTAKRRLLERLIQKEGAWLTDEDVKWVRHGDTPPNPTKKEAPKPKATAKADDATMKPSAEAETSKPVLDPEELAIRNYQYDLVQTLWKVRDVAQAAKPTPGATYTATVVFKTHLDKLVNFIYKLENESRWVRVEGLRLTVDKQEEPPMLGVNLALEATVLKPSEAAPAKPAPVARASQTAKEEQP